MPQVAEGNGRPRGHATDAAAWGCEQRERPGGREVAAPTAGYGPFHRDVGGGLAFSCRRGERLKVLASSRRGRGMSGGWASHALPSALPSATQRQGANEKEDGGLVRVARCNKGRPCHCTSKPLWFAGQWTGVLYREEGLWGQPSQSHWNRLGVGPPWHGPGDTHAGGREDRAGPLASVQCSTAWPQMERKGPRLAALPFTVLPA